ncbi:hypothetical protein F0562_012237 [Nyssa sinensis]|uniref:Uncharacterized protein n=1 Tax=Nyssa sinensis TaxID=561372 RepID=A0A5J4ZUK5_9ASTE|nr:hypothetical protein F0562_012237 [Nyssa sinensis]
MTQTPNMATKVRGCFSAIALSDLQNQVFALDLFSSLICLRVSGYAMLIEGGLAMELAAAVSDHSTAWVDHIRDDSEDHKTGLPWRPRGELDGL